MVGAGVYGTIRGFGALGLDIYDCLVRWIGQDEGGQRRSDVMTCR